MSKDFCMVAGCVEHATEYVELVTGSENKEVLTIVHICASCESLLSDYFSDDKPMTNSQHKTRALHGCASERSKGDIPPIGTVR